MIDLCTDREKYNLHQVHKFNRQIESNVVGLYLGCKNLQLEQNITN